MEDNSKKNFDEFEAFLSDSNKWANRNVTYNEAAEESKELIKELSQYNRSITIPLLASLLTIPELQSHCIRLEILVGFAVLYCHGNKDPGQTELIRWFSMIEESKCSLGEDPAEDVFVSLVQFTEGDCRIIEGIWESAGFYTQRVLDVIKTMPETAPFDQFKKSIHSLLRISDLLCEKSGLVRYQLGSDELFKDLSPVFFSGYKDLSSHVSISFDELESMGISPVDIEPFLLHPTMLKELKEQEIGDSYLETHPFMILSNTHLIVALPSAVSIALREFAIRFINEYGLTKDFDINLAKNYSNIIHDLPLLGGSRNAPVFWKDSERFKIAECGMEVDEGYYISYHFFMPSVGEHSKGGGFKAVISDDGSLTELLQSSVNNIISSFKDKEKFRNGLCLLIGCGWGKAFSSKVIQVNHPSWRLESIAAPDLVRLSWLHDMNPVQFWRVQNGYEAVSKSGVEIINPNGFLNLLGWVRSNHGHFVPHASMPDKSISKEHPFILYPPINLIRDLRAESDQDLDRHSVLDNTGKWHVIQHISPKPFFVSESERKMYVSMDDLELRKLTSIYDGKCRLWITVTTANTSNADLTYRLWEMASEWLHRIGDDFDNRYGDLKTDVPLKVYIEFLDKDIDEEDTSKPGSDVLSSLCVTEAYNEDNAFKAVFRKGFIGGFRIAENIAERLVVRNIIAAFLSLMGVENPLAELEEIERKVVPNDEARSFHLFHGRKFIDFVQDTLPKKLIEVNEVDDGAIKLGLGLRALAKDQDRDIHGKDSCNKYLQKVNDCLIKDIVTVLKEYDRASTLLKLVANHEKAGEKTDHWRRTSAALLGLHGSASSVDRYINEATRFANASISSRVLIEMALCICPEENGHRISEIELSRLMALAALIVRIGGLSDAIYYNALPPEIKISPLGDILFRDEFGELVVQPMLGKMYGDQFISNAPFQKKNYTEPEIVAETNSAINSEFPNIWKEEMGFEIYEARVIIDDLEDFGIRENTAIFLIKQNEFLKLVSSSRVSEMNALNFLNQYSLSTRPQWDRAPNGYKGKDIYPWRFGRRLSFATRPILKIDSSENPLLMIAPDALRKAFVYLFDGAYRGRLGQEFFHTPKMRNEWWGKASEGHSFTSEVANTLLGAGWNVRENIGLPELLRRKFDRDNGDVDVFAWRHDRDEILIIECKDLSPARNYSEIAALLAEYQGVQNDGKPDKLKRHLDRLAILNQSIPALKKFTGKSELKLVSCLVCNGVVPMQYVKIDALKETNVWNLDQLKGNLNISIG